MQTKGSWEPSVQGKEREGVSLVCKRVRAEQAPGGASRHSVDRK